MPNVMAKQKYRLQALLTIKANALRRAEIALAKAIIALRKAKERLKELEEEKKEIEGKIRKAPPEMRDRMSLGAQIGEGKRHVNFLRKLKEDKAQKEEEIEDQQQLVEERTEDVARARRAYIDAAKALKVMEKHKELWEKKIKEELTKKEEREMDELGSTIHQLRRWRGEKSLFETK